MLRPVQTGAEQGKTGVEQVETFCQFRNLASNVFICYFLIFLWYVFVSFHAIIHLESLTGKARSILEIKINDSYNLRNLYHAGILSGCKDYSVMLLAMADKVLNHPDEYSSRPTLMHIRIDNKDCKWWDGEFITQMVGAGRMDELVAMLEGIENTVSGIKAATTQQGKECMRKSLEAQQRAFACIVDGFLSRVEQVWDSWYPEGYEERKEVYKVALQSVREYRDGWQALLDGEGGCENGE